MPVHLYGQCADLGAAARARAADRRGRGAGARRGVPRARAGTLGDAAAYSFYPTKNLGALGDGGAVVTVRRGARGGAAACCARTASGPRRAGSPSCRGVNSRLDELQAEVLLAAARAARRGERAAARAGGALPRRSWSGRRAAGRGRGDVATPGTSSSSLADDRDAFRARLRERGVETLVHYPRADPPSSRRTRTSPGAVPLTVSERLCEQVVSLPLYPELTDARRSRWSRRCTRDEAPAQRARDRLEACPVAGVGVRPGGLGAPDATGWDGRVGRRGLPPASGPTTSRRSRRRSRSASTTRPPRCSTGDAGAHNMLVTFAYVARAGGAWARPALGARLGRRPRPLPGARPVGRSPASSSTTT